MANEETNTIEEWRQISGFPGYEVSNEGKVRSWKRGDAKILAQYMEQGYCRVNLKPCAGKQANISVHRLVAMAFMGPPPTPEHEVAHSDGTRSNNRINNLRWATRKENCLDQLIHGTRPMGEGHKLSIFTDKDVAAIKRFVGEGSFNCCEMTRLLGVSRTAIRSIRENKTWKFITPSNRVVLTKRDIRTILNFNGPKKNAVSNLLGLADMMIKIHSILDEMHAEMELNVNERRAEPWVGALKKIEQVLGRRIK